MSSRLPARRARTWCLSALSLALAVVFAPAVRAEVTLDALTPDTGTLGTVIDLRLDGDTGKGKPKLWLTRADDASNKPKKTKLKVLDVSDLGGGVTSFLVTFKKTKTGPGLYDLHVKPKGKGQVEQVFDDAFNIAAPVLAMVDPGTATSKSQVMLAGMHFGGPKKPKVRAAPTGGGKSKKIKVLSVTGDGMALAKLPKLGPGSYDVTLSNKVGESVLVAGLTVSGAGGPGPGNFTDYVRATLSADDDTLLTTQFNAEGPNNPPHSVLGIDISTQFGPQMTINAGMNVGVQAVAIAMTIPFQPGVTPTPFTLDFSVPAVFGIGFTQSSPHAGWDSQDEQTGTITIESATPTRVMGSFEFTLGPADGAPNPANGALHLTNGTFSVPVTTL